MNIIEILNLNQNQILQFEKDYKSVIDLFNNEPRMGSIEVHHRLVDKGNTALVKCVYKPINNEIIITEFNKFDSEKEYWADIKKSQQ